ncbi:MAG: hypothetical protein ACYDBV_12455 [Nitrospiria bacterium]
MKRIKVKTVVYTKPSELEDELNALGGDIVSISNPKHLYNSDEVLVVYEVEDDTEED